VLIIEPVSTDTQPIMRWELNVKGSHQGVGPRGIQTNLKVYKMVLLLKPLGSPGPTTHSHIQIFELIHFDHSNQLDGSHYCITVPKYGPVNGI